MSRRLRSVTWLRMTWRLRTSSSTLWEPQRNSSNRKQITCWTLNAAWRNRTKSCASQFTFYFTFCAHSCLLELSHFTKRRIMTNLSFGFCPQRKTGHRWANEGITGPVRSWTVFLCESIFCFVITNENVKLQSAKHYGSISWLLSAWAVMCHQNNIPFISVMHVVVWIE